MKIELTNKDVFRIYNILGGAEERERKRIIKAETEKQKRFYTDRKNEIQEIRRKFNETYISQREDEENEEA